MADPRKSSEDALILRSPASSADWDLLYDLRWRVLREPWSQSRGSERDDLEDSSYHLMLGVPGCPPVAVGRIHFNNPDEAQVRYMAVEENCRGIGAGGRILDGLEKFARSKSARRIVLNAREPAIPFYLSHGYRIEGSAETLFGEIKHVRMVKEL